MSDSVIENETKYFLLLGPIIGHYRKTRKISTLKTPVGKRRKDLDYLLHLIEKNYRVCLQELQIPFERDGSGKRVQILKLRKRASQR